MICVGASGEDDVPAGANNGGSGRKLHALDDLAATRSNICLRSVC